MEYRELIAKFAETCGIDGSSVFDGNGVASIMADDTELSFMELPVTRQLLTIASVADKPSGDGGRLYETLLEAQHLGRMTDGAAFSVSPEGKIMLFRRDALVELDVASLAKTVEGFLNLADKWREVIMSCRPESAQGSETVQQKADEPYLFMQV